MKFCVVALFLVASLVVIQGSCIGKPRKPSCHHPLDEGEEHKDFVGRRMWYYNEDSGTCEQMQYKGYGGNENRWCSKGECDYNCHKEIPSA